MIEVPVAQRNARHLGQVFSQAGGIPEERHALARVEEQSILPPFDQDGKPVFTDDLYRHAGRILAEYGYCCFQVTPLPLVA